MSYEVLKRIEGTNCLENRIGHNECLGEDPFVAKKKLNNLFDFILYSTEMFSNLVDNVFVVNLEFEI